MIPPIFFTGKNGHSFQTYPLACRNGGFQLVFQGVDEVVYVFLFFKVNAAGQCVEHLGSTYLDHGLGHRARNILLYTFI